MVDKLKKQIAERKEQLTQTLASGGVFKNFERLSKSRRRNNRSVVYGVLN